MRSEHGLSTILHCLQWYKLVLRSRLSTAEVQYVVYKTIYEITYDVSETIHQYQKCHFLENPHSKLYSIRLAFEN